jgi:hypothetical protein
MNSQRDIRIHRKVNNDDLVVITGAGVTLKPTYDLSAPRVSPAATNYPCFEVQARRLQCALLLM